MSIKNRRNMLSAIITLLFVVAALYVYPDSISLTAPLWDYCGLHPTHAGQALDCIKFDVDVTVIK